MGIAERDAGEGCCGEGCKVLREGWHLFLEGCGTNSIAKKKAGTCSRPAPVPAGALRDTDAHGIHSAVQEPLNEY